MSAREKFRLLAGCACIALFAGTLCGCAGSPPQILSLSPNHSSANVLANAPIIVEFNTPVTRQSLAAQFSISPGISGCALSEAILHPGTGTDCRVTLLSGGAGIQISHEASPFYANTKYTLSLGAGLAATDGAVNVFSHYWSFTTEPGPRVQSVSPSLPATGVPLDSVFTVTFNRPMSPDPGSDIRLIPSIPGSRVVQDSRNPDIFYVLPGELLAAHRHYTLDISRQVTDITGAHLVNAEEKKFETGTTLSAVPHLVLSSGSAVDLLPVVEGAAISAPVPFIRIPGIPPDKRIGDVVLSESSAWLAFTESTDGLETGIGLLNIITGARDTIPVAGSLLSWSPSGDELAFANGGTLDIATLGGGVSALPLSGALVSPPVWQSESELFVSLSGNSGSPPTIDAVYPQLDSAVALPGVSAFAGDPVRSPGGAAIAYSGKNSPFAAEGIWTYGTTPESAGPSNPVVTGYLTQGVTAVNTYVVVPSTDLRSCGIFAPSSGSYAPFTASLVPGTEPVVSPDGTLAAFETVSGGASLLDIATTAISSSVLSTALPSPGQWTLSFAGSPETSSP